MALPVVKSMSERVRSDSPGSSAKRDAHDPKLKPLLDILAESGRRFTRIYLYKTSLTLGEEIVPDVDGKLHHQGVVMEHTRDQGGSPGYLTLDFGIKGLNINFSWEFPHIPHQIDWSEGSKFMEQDIAPQHGNPKRLIHVLESVQGRLYDAWKWNCQSFTNRTYNSFVPWNTFWHPDLSKSLQRSTSLLLHIIMSIVESIRDRSQGGTDSTHDKVAFKKFVDAYGKRSW